MRPNRTQEIEKGIFLWNVVPAVEWITQSLETIFGLPVQNDLYCNYLVFFLQLGLCDLTGNELRSLLLFSFRWLSIVNELSCMCVSELFSVTIVIVFFSLSKNSRNTIWPLGCALYKCIVI